MEDTTISTQEIECLVGTELPIQVNETACCGAIICQECGPKLKDCPNRCLSEGTKLALNANKFVQRMINHIKVKCKYCNESFSRSEVLSHQECCEENKLKPVIVNIALHSCLLYKKEKTNNWFGDGLKIIKHGCALTGTNKLVHEKSFSWYGDRCDVDFGESGIQTYAVNHDSEDLKQFSKKDNMHLSHPHPFLLYFGANLPDQARENCYGKYKKNGGQANASSSLRYLVCFDCKFVLCEKCYFSEPDDFLSTVKATVHPHIMHLQAVPIGSTWQCDVKTPGCIKTGHQTNKTARISYRCDLCDFDAGVECLKVNSV